MHVNRSIYLLYIVWLTDPAILLHSEQKNTASLHYTYPYQKLNAEYVHYNNLT